MESPGTSNGDVRRWLFPRWTNQVPTIALGFVLMTVTAAAGAITYYGTDKHLSVGYQPTQPVDYSHKLHAGDMGMDCRYCHSAVEKSAHANVPATQTCMNCHWTVRTDSAKLLPVRESWATGKPIEWVKVHRLPDFVYFNHSAHLNANVGCASCHGRVDQMVKVIQTQSLSMEWCLDCHRNPGQHVRPAGVSVTQMDWKPAKTDFQPLGQGPNDVPVAQAPVTPAGRKVNPPLHCSGCHR